MTALKILRAQAHAGSSPAPGTIALLVTQQTRPAPVDMAITSGLWSVATKGVRRLAQWTIEDYADPSSGRRRVREFIDSLQDERDRKEVAALLRMLAALGREIRKPRSQALGDRLFEMRGNQVQIFYTFRSGRRIILLDGIIKKQMKIPADVLARVKKIERSIP
jgi:Phage derived protein Gp49-like (DUF891)